MAALRAGAGKRWCSNLRQLSQQGEPMILVRNVFRVKWGMIGEVAEAFKANTAQLRRAWAGIHAFLPT